MKTSHNKKLLCNGSLAAALFLTGCASSGARLDTGSVSKLKAGETTSADAVNIFGKPQSQTVDSNGRSSLIWAHCDVVAAPFYANVKTQTITAAFTNGVLERFAVSGNFSEASPFIGSTTPDSPAKSPRAQ